MTSDQLIEELKRRYLTAEKREVVLAIHLFGIEYSEALAGQSVNTIAEAATGHKSYGAEIRKGMRLAPHVSLTT
ncbi:MAG: hypothetical protein AAF479_00575 [Pseudomonadota bacterium]